MAGLEPEGVRHRGWEVQKKLQKVVEGLQYREEGAWLQNMEEKVEHPCLSPAKIQIE